MGAEPKSGTMKAEPVARHERRSVRMDAVARGKGGITSPVVVLDLSYEGCGIETPVELEPGEPVQLSVVGRGVIRTHVRWCKDGKAGLIFDPDEVEKKQSPRRSRTSVSADVSLRRLGQNNYRVRVNDLSPEGCRVELVEMPRVGERMLIKLDGLEVLEFGSLLGAGFRRGSAFRKAHSPGRVRPSRAAAQIAVSPDGVGPAGWAVPVPTSSR